MKPTKLRQSQHFIRNQEVFADIPSEIIIEILSKLPVRSIISCKCVCKSWLSLLESNEFVKSHLLKTGPGMAVYRFDLRLYKVFELDDGLDLEHHKSVTEFNIPGCDGWICGSADGLLFIYNMRNRDSPIHICNPITRDYIEPDCNEFHNSYDDVVTHGFGSSKITGQHKVVRIFQDFPKSECVCHVYTIGTGIWRRITHVSHLVYDRHNDGAFLNGNLHWLVSEFEGPRLWVSCFDLETERFRTFSSPLLKPPRLAPPTILGDCLCLCDISRDNGIAIWLMKEYGVEKSWTKQYLIRVTQPFPNDYHDVIHPIKIYKNGDILLTFEYEFLYYSKKNSTVQNLETFEPDDDVNAFLYTPSFLSLKSFKTEKVMSF